MSPLFSLILILSFGPLRVLANQCPQLFQSSIQPSRISISKLLNGQQIKSLRSENFDLSQFQKVLKPFESGDHLNPIFAAEEALKSAYSALEKRIITPEQYATLSILHGGQKGQSIEISEVINLQTKEPIMKESWARRLLKFKTPYDKVVQIYKPDHHLNPTEQSNFNRDFYNLPLSEQFSWFVIIADNRANQESIKNMIFYRIRQTLRPNDSLSKSKIIIPSAGLFKLLSKYKFEINYNGITPEFVIGLPTHNQLTHFYTEGSRPIHVQPPKSSLINTNIHPTSSGLDTGKTHPLFGYLHDIYHLITSMPTDPQSAVFKNFFPILSDYILMLNASGRLSNNSPIAVVFTVKVHGEKELFELQPIQIRRKDLKDIQGNITDLQFFTQPELFIGTHPLRADSPENHLALLTLILMYKQEVNPLVYNQLGLTKSKFDNLITEAIAKLTQLPLKYSLSEITEVRVIQP